MGNNIYTKKSSPKNIYLFKVNKRNTKIVGNMFKVNNTDTRTTFYYLWTYFTPFCSVSAVDLEQVNVCWIRRYQFMNAVYECIFSEITAHKKRLLSKVVVPKKIFFPWRLLCLIAGNSLFRVQCFFISRK